MWCWRRNGDNGPQQPGHWFAVHFRERMWAIACNTVAGPLPADPRAATSNLPWRIRMVFFMLVKAKNSTFNRDGRIGAGARYASSKICRRFFLTSG